MTSIVKGRASRARLEPLLGHWDDLVDPRVGVIREVFALPVDDDEPNFFHFLSTACDTGRFTPLSNFGNNGGVSTNRYLAIAKAMGEAVERYCSAIFDYADLVVSPYDRLDRRAVDPSSFALFSDEQLRDPAFPWRPFTPETPVAWTPARSLVTGDDVLVPAAMVFVPYHYLASAGETPVVQPISTGLAAGASFADAALSGLCEVVERDAFTITWQARLARPRIRLDDLPDVVSDVVDRYLAVALDIELIDITTDLGVPTVLSFALGHRPTSPALAVAAATAPTPTVAVIKSLEELAHTRKFARQLQDFTPPVDVEDDPVFSTVRDQRDHLRLYCEPEAVAYAEFAWSSSRWVSLHDVAGRPPGTAEEQLDDLVRLIASAGYDVLAYDLTTPDIASLGLSVVRVIVPGAHPLFMGHATRALGGSRLHEVPLLLGAGPRQPPNPFPHPFP